MPVRCRSLRHGIAARDIRCHVPHDTEHVIKRLLATSARLLYLSPNLLLFSLPGRSFFCSVCLHAVPLWEQTLRTEILEQSNVGTGRPQCRVADAIEALVGPLER